jgi:CRISPR-associated endonuclease/helicase Cas3
MYKNWGKSDPAKNSADRRYHLLVYHCLDVAASGNLLLREDPLLLKKLKEHLPLDDEQIISLVSFYLAIHDIGKFSERFQNLQPGLLVNLRGHDSTKSYSLRHDSMGFYLWKALWGKIWDENWLCLDKTSFDSCDWNDLLIPWITSTTGHHGNPPKNMNNGLPINQNDLFTEEDLYMAGSFIKTASDLLLKNAFDVF